jgi:hypothetical protein
MNPRRFDDDPLATTVARVRCVRVVGLPTLIAARAEPAVKGSHLTCIGQVSGSVCRRLFHGYGLIAGREATFGRAVFGDLISRIGGLRGTRLVDLGWDGSRTGAGHGPKGKSGMVRCSQG